MPESTDKPIQSFTVIGFDVGIKKIGVATGQTITAHAEPLCCLQATQGNPCSWEDIAVLLTTWEPFALIVGKPLNINGQRQFMTRLAENFAKKLKSRYGLPVYFIDERFSTCEARAEIFKTKGFQGLIHENKKAIDATAAQIILQEWLNGSTYSTGEKV